MADFNDPHKDQLYLDLLSDIRDLQEALATFMDSRYSAPGNLPTSAKRWYDASATFQDWSGSAWVDKLIGIAGGGTGAASSSGARTNLGVDSSEQVNDKITAHSILTTGIHGAVSTATANSIIIRDATGRAKVTAPSAASDIALLSNVTTHSNLTGASTTKPHGATGDPTANSLMLRDASAQSQVGTPTENAHIARKDYVDGLIAGLEGGGGTADATPDTIMRRDASGRSKVLKPAAGTSQNIVTAEIVNPQYVAGTRYIGNIGASLTRILEFPQQNIAGGSYLDLWVFIQTVPPSGVLGSFRVTVRKHAGTATSALLPDRSIGEPYIFSYWLDGVAHNAPRRMPILVPIYISSGGTWTCQVRADWTGASGTVQVVDVFGALIYRYRL